MEGFGGLYTRSGMKFSSSCSFRPWKEGTIKKGDRQKQKAASATAVQLTSRQPSRAKSPSPAMREVKYSTTQGHALKDVAPLRQTTVIKVTRCGDGFQSTAEAFHTGLFYRPNCYGRELSRMIGMASFPRRKVLLGPLLWKRRFNLEKAGFQVGKRIGPQNCKKVNLVDLGNDNFRGGLMVLRYVATGVHRK